ncbi:hypothetical protein AVEN_152390-1 [Araneus ventricosus]|uniref:Uncharacterized protein n=1 Tax=Araneus ventricosus TaxID=182803 RepID=A0A4Y2DDM6_ARAVE|nr:hypothetical protein AVEN_152390-1 [Araneus ventricosus]
MSQTSSSCSGEESWNVRCQIRCSPRVTDLAGPIFINEARASVVDFAFPVDFSQLVIISVLVPAHKDPFFIFGVFSLTKLVNTRLESVFERIKKNLIKMDTGIPPWLDAVEEGHHRRPVRQVHDRREIREDGEVQRPGLHFRSVLGIHRARVQEGSDEKVSQEA